MLAQSPQKDAGTLPVVATVSLENLFTAPKALVVTEPAAEAAAEAPAPKPAKVRVEWVDLAKGLTITLVVLLHATDMLVRKDLAPEFWQGVNGFLQPIRMPLFFVASGLFAQGMLKLTWTTMLRSRVAHLFYLYTVWMLMFFAAHNLLPQEVAHSGYAKFSSVVSGLYVPASALWFIYGLALYAVVTKAMTRLPLAVQFGAAFLLSVAAYGRWGFFAEVGFAWRNVAMYFVYFLLAVHAKSLVVKFSHRANGYTVLAALAAYTAVYVPVLGLNIVKAPELRLVVTTVGLGLGVLFAAWLVGTPLGNLFQSIGTRTLPVYVMMDILIAAAVFALLKLEALSTLPGVGLVLPVLVAAAVVATALALHRVFMAARMDFLFELHPRLRGTAKKA